MSAAQRWTIGQSEGHWYLYDETRPSNHQIVGTVIDKESVALLLSSFREAADGIEEAMTLLRDWRGGTTTSRVLCEQTDAWLSANLGSGGEMKR